MSGLWVVILDKGLRGQRRFNPEPWARARARTDALCDLCSCGSIMSVSERTITINAAAFYNREVN